MEKRAFNLIDSPQNLSQHDPIKKVKISNSPKKSSENNKNLINSDSADYDFTDICFDDDNDSFLESVLKVNIVK